MKGGADISDQQVIKRAVEAGNANVDMLSRELRVPVEIVKDFVEFYSRKPQPKMDSFSEAEPDDNQIDVKPKARKSRLIGN